jgi:hypothetical protein
MPQLDKLIIVSQFLTLSLLFLGLYFFLLKNILPRLLRIKILREKVNVMDLSLGEAGESKYYPSFSPNSTPNFSLKKSSSLSAIAFSPDIFKPLSIEAKYLSETLPALETKKKEKSALEANTKALAWVTYYCIAKNIIFLKGSVESKIRVFFAWTLSANIVQKGWLKKVNFYALNSLAPVEPLGAKDSVFSSKSLSLFKAKA